MAGGGEQIIVLRKRRYDFTDDQGKRVAGVNIAYTYGDVVEREDEAGLVEYDDTLPIEAWGAISIIPGVYEPVEEMRAFTDKRSGKVKRIAKIVGVKFVRAVGFGPVREPAPVPARV